MKYVLGLDLGETSLGWSVIEKNDSGLCRFIDFGVRIFPDGREDKSKEPLAVARRVARGMRRRRDRYVMRRKTLMNKLIEYGFMPADEAERKALEKSDPYELRAKALDQKLSPYELGRALFHINQRRGFKSNLKTDKKDADSGAMKSAISETKKKMVEANARTYGEYLYLLNKDKRSTQDHIPVRARSVVIKGKANYPLYPDRSMYEDEVRLIFEKQEIDKAVAEDLFHTIFWQRPLKIPELGFCTFEENEHRAYMAYTACQQSRILQQINQLVLFSDDDERTLTPEEREEKREEEREKLYHYTAEDFSCLEKGLLTWSAAKKILKVNAKCRFNLESEKRKGLNPDTTALALSSEDCFGKEWFEFSEQKQDEIVSLLINAQNESETVDELMSKYGLEREKAKNIASASLEDGVSSLS